MPTRQKLGTSANRRLHLGPSESLSHDLAHLRFMTTELRDLSTVLTLSELALQLGVTPQAIYDLRSRGRGPCGFRVGRELRFRVSEVEAWLVRSRTTMPPGMDAGRTGEWRSSAHRDGRPCSQVDRGVHSL